MSMELIQTVTVGSGGAAEINLNSIPQDGTDLLLLLSARADSSASGGFEIRLNNATGTYAERRLLGNGSTAISESKADTAFQLFVNSSDYTANTFSSMSFYIPNYTATGPKSVSIDLVQENNATEARQILEAASWSGTAAVSSIRIFKPGDNLVQHSTASLYKITKGSDGIVTTS